MKKLKIVYMGSGAFGLPSLDHLMSRTDIELSVVTQPDRPAGRGRDERETPVAARAAATVPLKKYANVNTPESIVDLQKEKMDILIVCDFGQILKPAILDLPAIGPFNIHGSLLPAYRGAAPIQRAILDGGTRTGVTLLRVNELCDAGPMISWAETEITPEENFGALHKRLAQMAVPLLKSFLDQWSTGQNPAEHPQDESKATRAPKIKKEELHLHFDPPAREVLCRIRAFSPAPGAYAMHKGARLKLLKASFDTRDSKPAEVPGAVGVSEDRRFLLIACGEQTFLKAEEVQLEGSRAMPALEFLIGHPEVIGSVLN